MYRKSFILLILGVMAFLLVWGEAGSSQPVLMYFDQGKAVELAAGTDSLLASGLDLARQSDLRYRLAVSDSLIKSIRLHDPCLEIILSEPLDLPTRHELQYRIDRILIPFSGLYATDTDSAAPVIFLGNGKYFSGPVGVSQGLAHRSRIQKLLQEAVSTQIQKSKP